MRREQMTQEWLATRCEEEGDCLVWQLAVNQAGQPRYTFRNEDGKNNCMQMRRVVWLAAGKRLRKSDLLTMKCGCQRCLNVEHMTLTTKREVISKMSRDPAVRAKKSRELTIRKRATAKLDMEKARYIRASDKTLMVLAAELGVSAEAVSNVRRGCDEQAMQVRRRPECA
jgi:hypothetical protein